VNQPETPELLPEQRDVDFAYRLAMADFRDLKRCKRDAESSEVIAAARAAYESSWAHYQSTKRLFEKGTTA
jgi:hypothetical protein